MGGPPHPLPECSAGFVSRAIAGTLDALLISGVFSVAISLLNGVDTLLGFWVTRHFGMAHAVAAAAPMFVAAYCVTFWTLFGQTPGKWLLGLRVVGPDGGTVSVARALLRFAGYVLSAVPFYAGFLWVLVDPQRRAWHDRLSLTYVVYVAHAARRTETAGRVAAESRTARRPLALPAR